MGQDSVSNYRWQPDRKTTPAQQAQYWQSVAMQYKSERDNLQKTVDKQAKTIITLDMTCQNQAMQIAKINRLLVFKPGDEV